MIRSVLPFFTKQQPTSTPVVAAEILAVDIQGKRSSAAKTVEKSQTVIMKHQLELQQEGELLRPGDNDVHCRRRPHQNKQQQQQQHLHQNKQRSFKKKLYNISKRSLLVNTDESFRRLDCDDDCSNSSSNSSSESSNSSRDDLNKSHSDRRIEFTFSSSVTNTTSTTSIDDLCDRNFHGEKKKDDESGGSITLSTTSTHENTHENDDEIENREALEHHLQQRLQPLHRHRKDRQKPCMSMISITDDRMEDDGRTACSTGTHPRKSSENQVDFLKVLLKSSSFSSSSLSPRGAPPEANRHPDTSAKNGEEYVFGSYEAALKGIDDSDHDEESVDSLLEHLPPIPDLDATPTKHESSRNRRSVTEALSTRTNQEREMAMISSQHQDEGEGKGDGEDEDEDDFSESSTSSVSLNDLFDSPTISCYKEKYHHSMPLNHVTDLLGSSADVLSTKKNRKSSPGRSAINEKKRPQLVKKDIEDDPNRSGPPARMSASTRSLQGACGSPIIASLLYDTRRGRPRPHRTKSASDIMLDHRNRNEGHGNHLSRRSHGGTPQGVLVDCSKLSSHHGERRGRRLHSCRNDNDERRHSSQRNHGQNNHRSLSNNERRSRSSSHTSNHSAPGSRRVVRRQELTRSSSYSHRHHASTHSSGNRRRCNSNSDRRGRHTPTSSRSHSRSKPGKEGMPMKSVRSITSDVLNDSYRIE